MTDLADLLGIAQTTLATAFVVFLRVGGAMSLMPLFGDAAIPVRLRLVIALAFTAVVAPAAAADVAPLADGTQRVIPYMLAETATGLCFGFAIRAIFWAIGIAGTIIAQTASLSQMFSFSGAEPSPAIGQLMTVSAVSLAAISGLPLRLAEGLIATYQVVPPGSLPDSLLVEGWAIGHVAGAMSLAFGLAMPFLIASTLYSLASGVINRALPQLMVSMIGAPAQVFGALLLLVVSLPVILSVWAASLGRTFVDPFGVFR